MSDIRTGSTSHECPACRRPVHATPMHTYDVDHAAAHFCPPSRNRDRYERLRGCVARLWGAERSDVYVCETCGFGFGWPHVAGDEEYYGILHEQAGYPEHRWEYGWTRDHVLPAFPEGGRLLDIGTGSGVFLDAVPSQWQTAATEGSPVTRARLRERGIECFEDTARAVESAAGAFTVVTMFQVLEHIAAFDGLLADCRRLLRPGGMIVISVPMAERIFRQERLTGCQDMTPNHINKWSPIALDGVLRRHGFEPAPPVVEPAGLRKVIGKVSLMTRAQASEDRRSLAHRAYAIANRRLRLGALAAVSALNLAGSLTTIRRLAEGVTFVMAARATAART